MEQTKTKDPAAATLLYFSTQSRLFSTEQDNTQSLLHTIRQMYFENRHSKIADHLLIVSAALPTIIEYHSIVDQTHLGPVRGPLMVFCNVHTEKNQNLQVRPTVIPIKT